MNQRMICQNCHKEFEPDFDVCWNCGADKNGNPAEDFVRPEDQPEDPKAFIDALNFMGWLTGTFEFVKRKKSKPWTSGDIVLPRWAAPIVIGIVVAIVGAVIKHWTVASIGIGLIALGILLFVLNKFLDVEL